MSIQFLQVGDCVLPILVSFEFVRLKLAPQSDSALDIDDDVGGLIGMTAFLQMLGKNGPFISGQR